MSVAVYRVTRILKVDFGATVKGGDIYSPIGDFIRTFEIEKKKLFLSRDCDSPNKLDIIFENNESLDFIQKISVRLSKMKAWI